MTDNQINVEELTVAQSREMTYKFLASVLFKELTADFLAAAAENPPVTEGVLGEYFASLKDKDIAAERTENAVKYAKLLLNASANPVIPYESPYTCNERILKQGAWMDVKKTFAINGFKLADGVGLPEDHISFELEFMAHMCRREQELLEACDVAGLGANRAEQRVFLTDHLLVWAGSFCDDLAWKSQGGFYAGVAETLNSFMAFEIEDFDIKEDEIKYPKLSDEDPSLVRTKAEKRWNIGLEE